MVKSAQRVFRIIEAVAEQKTGLSQVEMSQRLNIPKSSLSVLLRDLCASNYLILDESNKLYGLGPQLVTIASRYLDNQDVIRLGRPLITRLAGETGESAVLALLVEQEAVLMHKEDSTQPILPSILVGTRFPLYASAVGKAMLANFEDQELEQYLKTVELAPITPQTIVDVETLRQRLAEVRATGLAYNRGNYRTGIYAIASPVFDHTGRAIAAVSVSLLSQHFTEEKSADVGQAVIGIAGELSRLLGYSPH